MNVGKTRRVYHSNLNLPKAFTQYDLMQSGFGKSMSMEGLNRNHTTLVDSSRRKKMSKIQKNESKETLPLCLPRLEPEVDLDLDVEARDVSATTRLASQMDSNPRGTTEPEVRTEHESDSDESDYLNDYRDDTETAHKRLEQIGVFEMEHNWLLHEGFEREKELFVTKSRKINIALPDENPITTVNSRIEEVNSMVKPKADIGMLLKNMNPEQQEKIRIIAETDIGDIRKRFRKSWKNEDKLHHALLMIKIMNKAHLPRRKYFKEEKPVAGMALRRLKAQDQSEQVETPQRSSLAFDMELALITHPAYRTEEDLAKVMWVLRATKAFNHLFPVEKEKDLARVVGYEKYDPNRIMAYQGKKPERFYYILTGKVRKVREYSLSEGKVTRTEGLINKGTTTDLEELEEQWLREHHLVTQGNVEVLILHRSDLMRLQNKLEGPPIEYLRTLQLFYEFPVEVFLTNTDAIELKYYGQDAVISHDTNRTPWIHVVKSGRVRVVRMQTVIDVQNESKFANQKTEELGFGRTFSHADAMLGSLFSQRKAKAERGADQISFPEMPDFLRSPLGHTLGVDLKSLSKFSARSTQFSEGIGLLSNLTKRHKTSAQTDNKGDNKSDSSKDKDSVKDIKETRAETVQPVPEGPSKAKSIRRKAKLIKTPIIAEPKTDDPKSGRGSRADIAPEHYVIEEETPRDMTCVSARSSSNGTVSFPPINALPSARSYGEKSATSEFRPHGTFLTREKTEAESAVSAKIRRKKWKEHAPCLPKLRSTKLQLDILTAGDIFGLDAVSRKFSSLYRDPFGEGLEHLDPPIASEPKGVSLISDGAEIIRISKRFFLQHAQNNTMLRVETMQRDYMSVEEASKIIYTNETWNQYKDILMRRKVESLLRRD
ncbi:uncharacterized protein LOC133173364 isoform X1 [Saccostrea echinata]|uniref:uncharacterized protein LOC133173364 isoform X1 n=1 Tax=Saccostrea echinata TaxID=191078 RepID=UPI002A82F552|nr:uncharacterized protein LOC133173364 isoform X1 [Saccostrea echinata]